MNARTHRRRSHAARYVPGGSGSGSRHAVTCVCVSVYLVVCVVAECRAESPMPSKRRSSFRCLFSSSPQAHSPHSAALSACALCTYELRACPRSLPCLSLSLSCFRSHHHAVRTHSAALVFDERHARAVRPCAGPYVNSS